ncbi:hypothetical protein GQX74_015527 [Glossina fuscipes]|nr:hypothetical protein GQX74_015527 [Glossina fuscipes]
MNTSTYKINEVWNFYLMRTLCDYNTTKDYFFAGFVATTCLRLYSVCSEYASVLMIFQGDGAQVIGRSPPLTGTTNPRYLHLCSSLVEYTCGWCIVDLAASSNCGLMLSWNLLAFLSMWIRTGEYQIATSRLSENNTYSKSILHTATIALTFWCILWLLNCWLLLKFEHNDLRNNCSLGVDHSRTEFSNIVQLFTNVRVVKFVQRSSQKSQKCFRLIDASLNLQIKAEFIIMCDAQIYEVRNEGQLMGINIRARSYQNSPKYVKSKIT